MADYEPIPGQDVYQWYYTITDDEYNFLASYGDGSLVADFHHYTDGLWYAKQTDLDATHGDEAAAITGLGIEFGEAWFTRSTEPNWAP